ncbi:DUF2568 domain-containing protein [Gordonia hydrophobica]|uniref:DUF2568 domain-containing protein n=1 Tax=Gordonia hydrophobica TaxID=40516 RepID=A0ABZ2U4H9_9ACTN|nr:DUF2568 domain-containing protein [Gordonia hydrophobica]MBM7366819.1 hypothetical protein [Gordonia hydrophobica]
MTAVYFWTLATVLFIVELLMLGVLAAGVWQVAGRGALGWVGAVGTVVAVAAVWALFASPSPIVDAAPLKAVVKIVLFAAAALVLWLVHSRTDLAIAFAVVCLVVNIAAILPPYSNYGGFDVPS